jgi:monoamine oxidase
LGILKAGTVEFRPQLHEKQMAADELCFGDVVKIGFLFKRCWWPRADDGFVHSLEEPIPTWWTDSRGPLLTGWAGGTKADALVAMSPARLSRLGIEVLTRIFSENIATLRSRFVNVYYRNWKSDPHIRGAYSYLPVNGLDLPKTLASPVSNTLFFAGEATTPDAQMGTVFGAYESGLRAAKEILERAS